MKNIAVIGAGAAGMMAAIAASERARVTLFDKNEFPGRKLLQTGNGKCNFLNVSVSEHDYRGSVRDCGIFGDVYKNYGPEFLLELFSSFGLLYHIKNNGYYPRSDSSGSVNDILILELKNRGVSFHPLTLVKKIEREEDGFFLTLCHLKSGKKGRDERKYDTVIITTGGMAAPKTGSTGDAWYFAKNFGLQVEEPLPALTRLLSEDPFFNDNPVRAEVKITLFIDGVPSGVSKGELQTGSSGPSGICVFDLSGRVAKALKAGKKSRIEVDLLPEYSEDQVLSMLKKRLSGGNSCENPVSLFTGIFSERLTVNVINKISEELFSGQEFPKKPDDKELYNIARLIKNMGFSIYGTGDFNSAQVTSGGIKGESINPDLSAKGIPGLYFAGECLDIDGNCGGYNLYWAFASGYAAGDKGSKP